MRGLRVICGAGYGTYLYMHCLYVIYCTPYIAHRACTRIYIYTQASSHVDLYYNQYTHARVHAPTYTHTHIYIYTYTHVHALNRVLDSCLDYATRKACLDPNSTTITVDIQVLSVRQFESAREGSNKAGQTEPGHMSGGFLQRFGLGQNNDASSGGMQAQPIPVGVHRRTGNSSSNNTNTNIKKSTTRKDGKRDSDSDDHPREGVDDHDKIHRHDDSFRISGTPNITASSVDESAAKMVGIHNTNSNGSIHSNPHDTNKNKNNSDGSNGNGSGGGDRKGKGSAGAVTVNIDYTGANSSGPMATPRHVDVDRDNENNNDGQHEHENTANDKDARSRSGDGSHMHSIHKTSNKTNTRPTHTREAEASRKKKVKPKAKPVLYENKDKELFKSSGEIYDIKVLCP